MLQPLSARNIVSRKYRLVGLFLACLLACMTFFSLGGQAYAADPAVAFANSHWNCTTAACTSRVGAGAAQSSYQCAEFVARSLATDGYIPGLKNNSSQSAYGSYKPGNGKTYDLLAITPGIAGPGIGTLADFFTTYGYFRNVGKNVGNAVPGDMVVFMNSSGTPEHVVLIISSNYTIASIRIDAHNSARYNYPLSNEIAGFSNWYILHINTGA